MTLADKLPSTNPRFLAHKRIVKFVERLDQELTRMGVQPRRLKDADIAKALERMAWPTMMC